MNRRSFLQLIPAALAGATLDPERLLWVPGAKTIFLPTEATFALREFHGVVALSDEQLIAFAPHFMEALDVMDAAFRTRIFRLLNADLLSSSCSTPAT